MNEIITIENVIEYLKEYCTGRYQIEESSPLIDKISFYSAKLLISHSVIRLKRSKFPLANWKTVLIAIIDDNHNAALQWASITRDELLNNEQSDLYILILPQNYKISFSSCINIEANDGVCRKYVLRPEETITSLLDRTFLSKPDNIAEITDIDDPLRTALLKVGQQFDWFDSVFQESWKSAFLSGKHGYELAEELLKNEAKTKQL